MSKPDKPKFAPAETLAHALAECNGRVPEGMRAYRVQVTKNNAWYVVSNSPAQAALAVCEVTTCSNKEAMDAVLELLAQKG